MTCSSLKVTPQVVGVTQLVENARYVGLVLKLLELVPGLLVELQSLVVDPLVLLDIYTEIEQRGEELIGIFHTHPASPYPSGTDRHYMEVNPYVWLISSTNAPTKPRGYLLMNDGKLKEITFNLAEQEK